MKAGINTSPKIGALRHGPRARDHEEIPLGSLIQTPTGRKANVIRYRGFQDKKGPNRGHRVWLVCQYLDPVNKKFDFVQLLPELVVIIRLGPAQEAA